ncbi:MAG: hypothetical protein U0T02_01700 [Solirubrobacteraceae bacterium]
MRPSRAIVTALAAATALAAVPATAQAVIFRIDAQTYKGRMDAALTVTWTRAKGAVGARCRDWFSSSGTERLNATSREYHLNRVSGRVFGAGAFTGRGATSGKVTTAFSTEAGCPAVCASAVPGRPRARAADCVSADKRAASRWRCSARRVAGAVSLDGGPRIDALARIRPLYSSATAPKCGRPPDSDKPFRVNLGQESDLRHVGRRGRYIARGTRHGNCPGVKRVEGDGTRVTCRYRLSVTLNVRRTG